MCVFHAWSGELDIQIIAHVNMKFALAPSVKELTHAFMKVSKIIMKIYECV